MSARQIPNGCLELGGKDDYEYDDDDDRNVNDRDK